MWIFTRQKNPIVMKTCFSEGNLMKQFGNPPLSKRTPPLSTNPLFLSNFFMTPSFKNKNPLILGGRKLLLNYTLYQRHAHMFLVLRYFNLKFYTFDMKFTWNFISYIISNFIHFMFVLIILIFFNFFKFLWLCMSMYLL